MQRLYIMAAIAVALMASTPVEARAWKHGTCQGHDYSVTIPGGYCWAAQAFGIVSGEGGSGGGGGGGGCGGR